jgi:glycosyltransferase involved in cell wall biosynthesis
VLHGGLREILDRTCGFLIDRHDIELLAENLICVLEDPQLAVALGNAGRSRVMEFNSIEVHSKVIAKLLGIPTLTNQ